MLSLDDSRWSQLKGGRRTLCDPRPLLAKLEGGKDVEKVWHDVWDELIHQGDVDDASYACLPHLVRIYRQRRVIDWNTYAIVATIELERTEGNNPELPSWLKDSYFKAIQDLSETAIKELQDVRSKCDLRGILCILALQKGARTYARFLLKYSEEELLEIESAASEF